MASNKWTPVLGVIFLFCGVIAAERALFEATFPRWTWLGLPIAAVGISIIATILLVLIKPLILNAMLCLRTLTPSLSRSGRRGARGEVFRLADIRIEAAIVFPFLLNLFWLFDPTVDLIRSRWLLGLSLWLILLLTIYAKNRRHPFTTYCLLLLSLLIPLYWATLGRDVGSADTFEFQVTAPQLGIAHPTGYPLYLLLGKLWTLLLPFQSVAMRLNIGTAIYALIACVIVGWVAAKLFGRPLVGILVGVVFGLRPTFWSQAVAAEVYTLHAIFVAGAILLWQMQLAKNLGKRWALLAFWLGLGMTNHVTTVLLLPATAFLYLSQSESIASKIRALPKIIITALLPLLLYLYLPLRWQAVNGEAMGFGRFFQWVTGSRFAGALQWGAWLRDQARWGILGRFFLQEWGWVGLALIIVGFIYLLVHHRRFAIALFLTWSAFSFYCLNYYVPDLNVFLLPAHLTMAITLGGCIPILDSILHKLSKAPEPLTALSPFILLSLFIGVPQTFRQVDQSAPNELTTWATAILNAPLAKNATILADSDKFPPLYYLQQAEGMRPDLEIMMLPDEGAYRAALEQRVVIGQKVYLARFLPRLPYAMRATTPLVEIAPEQPLIDVETVEPQFTVEGIGLVESSLQLESDYGKNTAALSFTWRRLAAQPAPSQLVYLRWVSNGWATTPSSQHPVNNSYPTAAWSADEVVNDFYLLEKPLVTTPQSVELQIALGEAFRSADSLTWHTLKTVTLQPQADLPLTTPVRIWRGKQTVNTVSITPASRPEKPFSILLNGQTSHPQIWQVKTLHPTQLFESCLGDCFSQAELAHASYTWEQRAAIAETGRHQIFIAPRGGDVRCGWFSWLQEWCEIGRVTINGVPLPEGAVNFDDKVGLLSAEIPTPTLTPNGLFELTLNWQSLSPIEDDYTVFVQVLDENDTIVGQVDSWPVQGTYPTSQWEVGEIVRDPYQVQLAPELASGNYRLVVGFYRLRDLRRLPVLDTSGTTIEDRFIVPSLFVP